jgi:hypothetical protein
MLRVAWVFASAPFWETVSLGQIYGLLGLVSVWGWVLVERRPLLSGVLIGVVAAFKPNFLVWPGLLLVAGYGRAAVSAAVTAAGLGVLAAAVFGPGVYGSWLGAISRDPANPQVANAAVAGLLVRIGAGGVAPIVEGLGLAGLAVLAWRCRPSARRVSSLALIGLLMFSPLAWVGYGLFLLPLFFERAWTPLLALAAALLLIPRLPAQQASDGSAVLLLSVGSAYSWSWLVLLGQQVRLVLRGTPARS